MAVTGLGGLALFGSFTFVPAAVVVAVGGMALTGAALGLCLQAHTLLGQAMAPPADFGAAMAALTFSRQLGALPLAPRRSEELSLTTSQGP